MGVSKTSQVRPRSGEWKTRAALPPVANQMFGSGAKDPSLSFGLRGAEAPLFHGCACAEVMTTALVAPARPRSLAALGMTGVLMTGAARMTGCGDAMSVRRIARQVLLAAKAASPSSAGAS